MAPLAPHIVYRVDEFDRLVWFNDAWTQFALDNHGHHLISPSLLGRNLWDLIRGDAATVLLYSLLLDRLRDLCRTATFPFRCDSPEMGRLMRMTVMGLPRGDVEFRVDTVMVRPRAMLPFFDATRPRSHDVIEVCGICARVSQDRQQWEDAEAASLTLSAMMDAVPPVCGHALCARCLAEFTGALDRRDPGHFGTASL